MKELLPSDRADILAMEPEEAAGYLLTWFNQERVDRLVPEQLAQRLHKEFDDQEIVDALMEAWPWLLGQGLLVPRAVKWHVSGDQGYRVSRRGQTVRQPADLKAIQSASRLPRAVLHPQIIQDAWPAFLRGEYDLAVFAAFRRVEIAVREAGQFPAAAYGTDLMRDAFKPGKGQLSDDSLVASECESIAHLFAGSIGWFKNPSSHRDVKIDQAVAIEAIGLASYLMRYLESRARRPAAGGLP